MKIFVTGVGGQLGHDVINELAARGQEGIGSDIAPSYAGMQDGSAAATAPWQNTGLFDYLRSFAPLGIFLRYKKIQKNYKKNKKPHRRLLQKEKK